MDLVSELCGKLRDLERSEDQQEIPQVLIERQESAPKATMNSAGGGGGSASVSSSTSAGTKAKEASKKASRGGKSNPYYQMFPALSGNLPASNSSSRATSISGGVMSESSTSSNWGRGEAAHQLKTMEVEREFERQQRKPDRMTSKNGTMVTGGGGGGCDGVDSCNKGAPGSSSSNSSKRKNKKRRTNGESGSDNFGNENW